MGTVTAARLLAVFGATGAALQAPQQPIVVGVAVEEAAAAGEAGRDLQEIRQLRFNVVAVRDAATGGFRIESLARLSGQSARRVVPLSPAEVEVIEVHTATSAAALRLQAWRAIARGARGVIFDGWTARQHNAAALAAAASFADNVTRNAALFAPLRLRRPGDVRLDVPSSVIEARFLESDEALVFIAANLTASVQQVTMAFTSEIPEAIWQNIEAGGAVNFVAGPEGPIYVRNFAPFDVIVLVIRRKYR